VTNVNDNPVVLVDSNAAVNTVAENAANGRWWGSRRWGPDADVGATVTYSLSNDAGAVCDQCLDGRDHGGQRDACWITRRRAATT
jgi:hypothetical protein